MACKDLGNTSSHGFRDLVVHEQLTDSEAHEDPSGECKLVPTETERTQYRLQHDGKAYVIPNAMKHFMCGVC